MTHGVCKPYKPYKAPMHHKAYDAYKVYNRYGEVPSYTPPLVHGGASERLLEPAPRPDLSWPRENIKGIHQILSALPA